MGREKKFSITLQPPAGDPSSLSLPGTVWPPVLGTRPDSSRVWRSLERRQPNINTQLVILGFSHSQIHRGQKGLFLRSGPASFLRKMICEVLRASDLNCLTFSKRADPGSCHGRTELKRAIFEGRQSEKTFLTRPLGENVLLSSAQRQD